MGVQVPLRTPTFAPLETKRGDFLLDLTWLEGASKVLTHVRERWAQLGTRAQIGLVLAALAVLACLFFIPLPSPHTIRDWVGSTGPWAPLAYLVSMVLCTQFP